MELLWSRRLHSILKSSVMVSTLLLGWSDSGDRYGMWMIDPRLATNWESNRPALRESHRHPNHLSFWSAYQNKPLPGLDFESAIADPDFFDKYLFPGELPIEIEHQSSILEINFCLSLFLSEFGSFHSASSLLPVYEKLLSFPIPTIASVGGHGFAAGFGLAMAHDFRVMNGNRGYLCMNEIEWVKRKNKAFSTLYFRLFTDASFFTLWWSFSLFSFGAQLPPGRLFCLPTFDWKDFEAFSDLPLSFFLPFCLPFSPSIHLDRSFRSPRSQNPRFQTDAQNRLGRSQILSFRGSREWNRGFPISRKGWKRGSKGNLGWRFGFGWQD